MLTAATNGDGSQAHPWKTLPGVTNLAASKARRLPSATCGSPRLHCITLTYWAGNSIDFDGQSQVGRPDLPAYENLAWYA